MRNIERYEIERYELDWYKLDEIKKTIAYKKIDIT